MTSRGRGGVFAPVALVLIAGCSHCASSTSLTPPDCGSGTPCPRAVATLGTNLNQNINWSTEWVFVDAYRRAYRPVCAFASGPNFGRVDPSCTIDFDADGWPSSS